MATVAPFINAVGENGFWFRRLLGARDAETGWKDVTWEIDGCFDCDCFDPDCFDCAEYIKILKEEVSLREVEVGGTRFSQRVIKFFTYEDLEKYDRIKYHDEMYEVESITPTFYLLGDKAFQHAVMVQMSFYGDY